MLTGELQNEIKAFFSKFYIHSNKKPKEKEVLSLCQTSMFNGLCPLLGMWGGFVYRLHCTHCIQYKSI